MDHRYPLKTLVAGLPHRAGHSLRLETSETGLEVNVKPSGRYVWPDLLVSLEAVGAPVILISAPGAMGKSMAARAVAAELNAPFVDLSHLSVGSNTLTGLLAHALGWTQTPDLIKDLRSGKSALVLDGLDEAQLRAGRDNTVSFLENVVELVKDAESPIGQIIIFGRRDAIETSYLVFSDNDITTFSASIAPLTRSQADELIGVELDHKLQSGQPYDVHRIHPVPFAALRDELFRDIAEALGATISNDFDYWESVCDFVGYPPVLLVFAERLAVDNPSADLSNMLARPSRQTRTQHGDLLRKIVEGILDRESQKVRNQLTQAISVNSNDSEGRVLYTREEQLLRLLNYSSDHLNLKLLPPAVLSDGDRAIYEQQISTFVPDHPFLRDRKFANVVFGDYVRAYIATGQQVGVYGRSKAEVLHACPAIGPFFAELVYSFLCEQSANSIAILPGEDLVDDLVTSYYLGCINGGATFVYTHTTHNAYLLLNEVSVNDSEEEIRRGRSGLYFQIEDPSGVLELTTPLMNSAIVSRHGLVLKSLSDEIEIGPNFVAFVGELEIVGRKLTALGARDDQGGENSESMIFVTEQARHNPALSVSCHPPTTLKVWWREPWHMWRPYIIPRDEISDAMASDSDPASHWQILIGVRRILTSFRGTIHNPSINRDRLDQYGTGSNPVFVAILNALIELGIVQRAGLNYQLQLGVLSEYGISYNAVRGADFADSLSQLAFKLEDMEAVRTALRDSKGENNLLQKLQ